MIEETFDGLEANVDHVVRDVDHGGNMDNGMRVDLGEL